MCSKSPQGRPWMVAVSGSLGMYLTVLYVYSLGVMIEPLEREFGWSRANITSGSGIVSIVAIFGNPFMGIWLDRISARFVALFGIGIYCLAFSSLATSGPDLFGWRLRWVLIAIASLFICTPVWMTGVTSRFTDQRGLAIGIVATGAALSAASIPYIANSFVVNFGWRQAYVLLSACGFIACFGPTLCFFFDARAEGVQAKQSTDAEKQVFAEMNVWQAIKTWQFCAIAVACLLVTANIISMVVHFVPILGMTGIKRATAVEIAGVIGLAGIVGRMATGYLLDKIEGRFVAAVAFVLPVVACILCSEWKQSNVAALLSAVSLGVALGAETDCTAYLTARYFGLKSYGTLYGIFSGLISAGAGLGPFVGGWVYDRTHSYDFLLRGSIPTLVGAAGLMLSVGPYPLRLNEKVRVTPSRLTF